MNIENLKQIKANFEIANQKYKDIKSQIANMQDPDKMKEMMTDMEDNMYRMVSYVHQRMDWVENALFEHSDTSHHLPPIAGAGQMEHCLKTLGLDKDYQVQKKVIYANTKKGLEVEIS